MNDERRTANGEYTYETHRNRCAKGWQEAKTIPIVHQPRIANWVGLRELQRKMSIQRGMEGRVINGRHKCCKIRMYSRALTKAASFNKWDKA